MADRSSSSGFEIDTTSVQAKLSEIAAGMPGGIARALYAEALVIQRESMKRTPVDTGALRASHVTKAPESNGGEISVKIEVGGPAAPYAVFVHENMAAHHEVGQAKFLESAILEGSVGLRERIAKRIEDEIK